ncbi:Cullin-associated NEDD8-dissociated protein 1 [Platanthera guangdongensis]|uniref:Cullin-associated NEDD8-dissociated protein 1 n=1 Tax=Platanthera guangdongensis TaxID=2320717 RepID=A0ABR2M7E6_9ASPA
MDAASWSKLDGCLRPGQRKLTTADAASWRKAFAVIANSPLRVDLSCVLEQVVSELTAFLRKANRALRQVTLGTLNALLVAYGDRISSLAYEVIVVELSMLISDMDLHMTALALELCCTLMTDRKSCESVGLTVRQKVLPQALILIRSSLLQGHALQAKKHLALLCLGEIGRRKDLSVHSLIENIIIESFQSPFEEIKSAASYALGNIAVGNLSKFLPFILNQIDNQQKKQYLLLHSLKEVISRQSSDKTGQNELQHSYIEKMLALLFNHCESEEEGVRNVVAECLGKIALIEPRNLIPALKVRTTSPAAFTRATVVIAVKYSIVERPEKIDEILYPEISTFLMLIKDNDRHVRRAAVLALSTAAHNKPNLIKGLLPEMLILLYDQTVVKVGLTRSIVNVRVSKQNLSCFPSGGVDAIGRHPTTS